MDTIAEVQTATDALAALMLEKGIEQPRVEFSVKPNERMSVYIRENSSQKPFEGRNYKFLYGENAADLFAKANAYIAALPSAENLITREYLSRVASAVDYATENSLPDEYVTPLRGVTCALTENLLTHDAVAS